MTEPEVFAKLDEAAVVAVLVIDSVDDAVPVAEALLEGGVTAMELTLRTPAAIGALKAIAKGVPDMLAGIGTILNVDQVAEVVDSGASFGVSPGMNPKVVECAIAAGLPFAPGICTPSDIERALEFDRKLLKFFPCESSGGLPHLKNIAAPYQHLGLKYVPLGGLNMGNASMYLDSPLIAAIGGSWLAPRDVIAAKDWGKIRENAQGAAGLRG